MSLRGVVSVCSAVLLYVCAQPAGAQTAGESAAPVDAPAHVSFVDGAATLERDGQPDTAPFNMPLLAGDRIRTEEGRVEILFADGSTLHLDRRTTVDFQSDALVRLLDGRVRLSIPGATRDVSYRIDAPWASADIVRPGEYRVAIVSGDRGDEIELAVVRGAADLVNEQGRTQLAAGERAFARANAAPSYAYVYNSASWDAFDRWSEARRSERLGVSTQYLPDDVRPYAASFDRYGDWRYETSYGYVWYPRVSVGWRPYYHGRWVTLRPYGWTWIGVDPWAWPTHHYGRWGITTAGAWYWIPGRRWGAAWVSWAYAPGYVSWCALGWNNRPVLPIYLPYRYGHRYDPWHAWTALPQRHFRGGHVSVRAAGPVIPGARVGFAVGARPPAYVGTATARAAAPIHVAGTGRRSVTSPLYTNLPPGESRIGSAPSRTQLGAGGQPNVAGARPRAGVPATAPQSAARDAAPSQPAAPAGQRPSYGGGGQRPDYGTNGRTPSRGAATPRENREYAAPAAPARTNQPVDHGVGGSSVSPRAVERAPAYAPPRAESPAYRAPAYGAPASGAPAYGAPAYGAPDRSPRYDRPSYGAPSRERGRDTSGDRPPMGERAAPREGAGGPPQGYRAPRESQPDRSGAAPRSQGGPPRADRPSGGGAPPPAAPHGARPGGGGAAGAPPAGGRARPRGGN